MLYIEGVAGIKSLGIVVILLQPSKILEKSIFGHTLRLLKKPVGIVVIWSHYWKMADNEK